MLAASLSGAAQHGGGATRMTTGAASVGSASTGRRGRRPGDLQRRLPRSESQLGAGDENIAGRTCCPLDTARGERLDSLRLPLRRRARQRRARRKLKVNTTPSTSRDPTLGESPPRSSGAVGVLTSRYKISGTPPFLRQPEPAAA